MSMMPLIASAADLPAGRKFAEDHPGSRWYYVKRCHTFGAEDQIPDGWDPDPITAARMPKLGTGKRFSNLKRSLAAKGATNPGALAAYIGRRKFGAKRFAKLGAKARTASAITADGQPLSTADWLRTVRSTISSAGMDPDTLEATIGGGYATSHDPGQDPVAFAEEVLDKAIEELRQDPEFDEYMELLGPDGDDEADGDGEDTADDAADGDEAQPPADQAAAPAQMPVPALAAGGQTFYIGQQDPAAFAASLQPHIAQMVNEAITAAYAPTDDEDLFEGPEIGPPDAEDLAEGAEATGDNADGMPDGAVPEGDVVPDVGAPMDDAGLEDAKDKLRASFAAAAPPPRRPSLNAPPTAPPSVPPPPSTSVPTGGPFRRRPVMAAGDMQARLAARTASSGGGQGNS